MLGYESMASERDFTGDPSEPPRMSANDPGPDGRLILCNNGHGTATLALLSGKRITSRPSAKRCL